jgi:DNA-binding transcriptional LysR family regulator
MPPVDTLQTMKVFVRVAQRAGFAAAARDLRLSPAAVTKHIAALEARLGTRLFDRTTRRVGMTEAGQVYLERCLECLQSLEDADASVTSLAGEPRGLLRVTAPVDFAHNLAPTLAGFLVAHAGIQVDLRLSNRSVDLVEEGFDVAVRVARSLDGPFVARPLALTRPAVWGSPAYFRQHGRPRVPEDLAAHRSVVFAEPRIMEEVMFERGGQQTRVKLNAVMVSNSGEALRLAAQAGVGLTYAPSFMTMADYRAGLLEPVLLDWTMPAFKVYALYPHRRYLSPKVRVFVEALRAAWGDGTRDPWWPEAGALAAAPPARPAITPPARGGRRPRQQGPGGGRRPRAQRP